MDIILKMTKNNDTEYILTAQDEYYLRIYDYQIANSSKMIAMAEEGLSEERATLSIYYKVLEDLEYAKKNMVDSSNIVHIRAITALDIDIQFAATQIEQTRRKILDLKSLIKDHEANLKSATAKRDAIMTSSESGKVLPFKRS